MTAMRPPGRLEPSVLARASGMEAEILHEKAATLHRLDGRLQEALRALREFDDRPAPGDAETRKRLVAAAGEALWYYVVQREVCGLRGTERLLEELSVPREVQLRMGVREPGSGR